MGEVWGGGVCVFEKGWVKCGEKVCLCVRTHVCGCMRACMHRRVCFGRGVKEYECEERGV